jgi:high-affinity iron transporter
MAAVSPRRAFHAITFGLPGTAMRGYPSLSDDERWSLAFYVLSLRHGAADLAAGKRALSSLRARVPDSASELYAFNDDELRAGLATIPDAPARANALAYLRVEAPFAKLAVERGLAQASLGLAYQKLDAGLDAYRRGAYGKARQLFISAYLDGFEPHETALRARDPVLVGELESAMLALRTTAAQGARVEKVEARVRHARALLARAESLGGSATAAFVGALTITLREGVEIVLLVAALLSLVRKRGHDDLARYVHAGWLLAIPAGLLTYWLAGSILGGMERELAEGVASLVAAVVLLGVTHWLLGQIGAKRWGSYLARRMEAATRRGAAFGVCSLAFVAAYREAFEVVLFFHALVLDAERSMQGIWLGILLGLALLAVVAVLLLRVGRWLKPAPFMLASSSLLALLSLMLIGKGVRALQEAGALDISPLPLPELPPVGLYATAQGLLAQGIVFALLVFSLCWPWLHARWLPPKRTLNAHLK